MIIQNKQTKKQYPISRTKWNALSARHQALFVVVDGSDVGDNEKSQPVKNVVKKAEPQKNTTPRPNTGDKADKNSTHKNNKK